MNGLQNSAALDHLSSVHGIEDHPEKSPGELLIDMRAEGTCTHLVKGFDDDRR